MDFVEDEQAIYKAMLKEEHPTDPQHKIRSQFQEQWMNCVYIAQRYRERVIHVWYAKLCKLQTTHNKVKDVNLHKDKCSKMSGLDLSRRIFPTISFCD